MDQEKRRICFYGFIFVTLAFMSIKLTVPALAILNVYFETSLFMLKLVGALYLIVLAISQLFWGAMTRPYHRKRIFKVSILIALVGTVISFASVNVGMFMVGRLIEAFGVGASSTLCRVMMADRLEKNEMASVVPLFGVIFNFGPFVGPTIGQYLILYVGWRSIYAVFFVVMVLFYYYMNKRLPETKTGPEEKPHPMHVIHDYVYVGTSGVFWSYIIGYIALVSLLLGYYMTIPFWYLDYFKINPHTYVFLALFTAIPNLIAYFHAQSYLSKHSAKRSMFFGFLICSLGALLGVVLACFFDPSPWNLIAPLMVFAFGTGYVQTATNVGLLHSFRKRSGVVAAMIPVSAYTGGGIGFLILSSLPLTTLFPFACVLVAVVVVLSLDSLLIKRYH